MFYWWFSFLDDSKQKNNGIYLCRTCQRACLEWNHFVCAVCRKNAPQSQKVFCTICRKTWFLCRVWYLNYFLCFVYCDFANGLKIKKKFIVWRWWSHILVQTADGGFDERKIGSLVRIFIQDLFIIWTTLLAEANQVCKGTH